jgi:putative ABC transport system permease protein
VDEDFVPTLGLRLVSGRNFGPAEAEGARTVLLNESAARAFGYEDPVGRRLFRSDQIYEIVGVVNDWHTNSIHSRIYPVVLFPAPETASSLVMRLPEGGESSVLGQIREIWERLVPGRVFQYAFVDDLLAGAYEKEQRLVSLLVFFCGLTVFVACLGIVGLASYGTKQRTKEIGVRKILGASVSGVIGLLIKSFARWVVIANLLAWPVAYYAAGRWLRSFAYRTPIGVWPFVLAGLLALTVALLSVIYQAYRAAAANPIHSLRYE